MNRKDRRRNQRELDKGMEALSSGAPARMAISAPYVIVFEAEGSTQYHFHPPKEVAGNQGKGIMFYGMLMSDIVRHVAQMYEVPPDTIWQAVDMERQAPTGNVEEVMKMGVLDKK